MERRTALLGLLVAAGGGIVARFREVSPFAQSKLALSGAPAPAGRTIAQSGAIRSVAIRPVPLGGGGYVTGVDQSADGMRFVCRTDVCNAYVRDADQAGWRPLFSPETMRVADYDPPLERNRKADGQGVAGVRIAPSDKNVIYASYYGYIWRSTDGGKSIGRTALPQKTMPSNAGVQRIFNRAIDVHPTDANQVLVGTWGEGVWRSGDGGANWTQIALPPAHPLDSKPGLSLVLFDPHRPDSVYVFVCGVGLFASQRGAAGQFAAVGGGPRLCSALVADGKGAIYLCERTGTKASRLWRFRPGEGWASFRTPYEMRSVAVCPDNPQRLFGSSAYGFIMTSEDGGATWRRMNLPFAGEGGEVGWISEMSSLSVAQIIWDARGGDAVWFANGVGVARGDLARKRLIDWSAGIEETIAFSATSIPGGHTVLTTWDKGFWRLDSDRAYINRPTIPVREGLVAKSDVISHGTFVDYAPDDPMFLVGVVTAGSSFQQEYGPGFSVDGGATWTLFAQPPPRGWRSGGCIAASSRDNFVLLPSNNGFGAFTLDGGKSWRPIRLDGAQETAEFANSFYVVRKNLAADKTRKGVFALVYKVMQRGPDHFGNPLGGLWLTEDGGQSWRRTLTGVINAGPHAPLATPRRQDRRQFWRCQLDYVPGRSGELVYTSYADYDDDRLWWSRDDGAHWTELHGSIRAVVSFGFGPPAPGGDRPAVYFYGKVDGKDGVYASFDWFKTKPALVSLQPSPQLAKIVWVTGDANRFGRIYLGTGGGGWLLADIERA